MSVSEILVTVYAWLDFNALELLIAAVVIPVVGTLLAWVGKSGRTDRDGRLVASLLVGFGLVAFCVEVLALVIAHVSFGRGVLDANVFLLLSPVLCLTGCLLGIRMVFPLSGLASVRTFTDVGFFVAACFAVVWIFSKFRGWGILFLGGIGQLLVIGVLGFVLLKTLYKRAFVRR